MTSIDDATRCTLLDLMKSKDEVLSNFKVFYHVVENKFNRRIEVLRSCNGREQSRGVQKIRRSINPIRSDPWILIRSEGQRIGDGLGIV